MIYAMIYTHLDIWHVFNVVNYYIPNSGKAHWHVVKWVFRYLRDTIDTCLQFERTSDPLIEFVYSDFVGNLDT